MAIHLKLNTQKNIILIILPVILFFSARLISPNNLSFFAINPHPYLIVAILYSAYYGVMPGLNLSILLSILYFSTLHFQTDYQNVETIFTFYNLSFPLAMIFSSLMVGELRSRAMTQNSELKEKNQEQQDINNKISSKITLLEKQNFEIKKQFVTRLETTASVFKMVEGLGGLDVNEIIENFFKILQHHFSITLGHYYLYRPEFKQILCKYTFSQTDQSNWIEKVFKIKEDPLIAKAIKEKKICHFKEVLNENPTSTYQHSLVVLPIIINDTVYGLITINEMPFLQFSASNLKHIELYTLWLSRSLDHSIRFNRITYGRDFDNELNLYSYSYFTERIKEEFELAQKYNLGLTTVKIKMLKINKYGSEKVKYIRKSFAEILKKLTRKIDCVCIGEDESYFYIIINTQNNREHELFTSGLEKYMEGLKHWQKLQESMQIAIFVGHYSKQKDVSDYLKQIEI